MKITGMDEFQSACKAKLLNWYAKHKPTADGNAKISKSDVFIVWACKALQNYKCLVGIKLNSDVTYAEYTYNGDKEELYEDIYYKLSNTCYKEM